MLYNKTKVILIERGNEFAFFVFGGELVYIKINA